MPSGFSRILPLMLLGTALSGCLPSTPPATDAAATIGPVPAPAGGCQLSFATSVPLGVTPHSGKFFIPVTMEGTKLTLQVDTGAEGLMLTQEAARRASRAVAIGSLIGGSDDEQRQGFSSGVGGSRVVNYIQVQRLDIGRVHGSFGASVSDMELSESDQKIDGLIGMAALGNFDIDFDVPGHELRLYVADGKCSAPAVALDEPIYSMPLVGDNHKDSRDRERIDVQINGHTLRALIDSGAPNTLIFGPSAARAGLSTTTSDASALINSSGIGGNVKLVRQRVDTMTVGPLTFHNVAVVVDPEGISAADMLLGRSFLNKVHVWISNSSHTLVMQYPPKPSPPIVMQ